MSVYNPERKWPRLVPANAIMVSVFSGLNQAFGLLANISEAGACVVSGVHFPPDSKILLRIEFDHKTKPFSTAGKVIWSRDETPPDEPAAFVHGVRFTTMTDEQILELHAILNHPSFKKPVVPGKSPSDSGELDEMMVELHDDLEELGTKIRGDDST